MSVPGAPGCAEDGHEVVVGPVLGFWFACYTVRDGEGYYGYAKLCADRPADVWDTPRAVVKVGSGPHAVPERALLGVVGQARRQVERRAAAMPWFL